MVYTTLIGLYLTLNGLYPTLNGLYPALNGLYPTLNSLHLTLNGLSPTSPSDALSVYSKFIKGNKKVVVINKPRYKLNVPTRILYFDSHRLCQNFTLN